MDDIDGIFEFNKQQGIYIDIGTRIFLEIEGVSFSVSSVFIGMLKDEFIIITLPKRYKSVESKLYSGSKMIVKYLFDGSVYAFQTSVIETITSPIKALALEFPRVVQQSELRSIKRNSVVIPARMELKKMEFSVVVFDVSKQGCRFKFREETGHKANLREDDILRLYCKFPGEPHECGVMAGVRNIRREESYLSVGVAFLDVSQEFSDPLMHLLFSIEGFN